MENSTKVRLKNGQEAVLKNVTPEHLIILKALEEEEKEQTEVIFEGHNESGFISVPVKNIIEVIL